MYRFGILRFNSVRIRLVLGSIAVLLGLIGWAGLHTKQVLHSFSLDTTRTVVANTAAALSIVVRPLAADGRKDLVGERLDDLVRGGLSGITYIALVDAQDRVLAKSRATPTPLLVSDLERHDHTTGIVHARYAIDWQETAIHYIHFGVDTRLSQAAISELWFDYLLVLGGGLVVVIVVLSLIGLNLNTDLGNLVRLGRALAGGERQIRLSKLDEPRLDQIAESLVQMADKVDERNAVLADVEANLNVMLGAPGLFMGLIDRDGSLSMVSEAVLVLDQLALSDVLGAPLWDLPMFRHDEASRELVRRSALRGASGKTIQIALRCSTRVGMRTGELTLQAVGNGDGRMVWSISFDIGVAECKPVETARESLDVEWDAVFDAVTDPVAILDDGLQVVKANRAFETLAGRSAVDLLGGRCGICEWDGVPQNVCPHGIQLKRDPKRVVESIKHTPVGYFKVTTSAITDDTGGFRGAVCVSHDLTKDKEAEKKELAVMTRQKDTLIREVHHRIKNHLQGVIGLLRQTQSDHPEVSRVIGEAVNRIVSIATVYGLQSRSANASLDLAHLLRAIINNTRNVSPQAPMSTTLSECEGNWVVASDKAVALALVLNELILNAAKHGSDEENDGLSVECKSQDGCVTVIIVNPGELPEDWDYRAGQGIGTGLDLVRHMLPRQGADLSIVEVQGRIIATLSLRSPLVSLASRQH